MDNKATDAFLQLINKDFYHTQAGMSAPYAPKVESKD